MKANWHPSQNTINRIVEIVNSSADGLEVTQVAEVGKVSPKWAKRVLIDSRRAGLIDYVQVGRRCFWCKNELVKELKMRRDLAASQRRVAREKLRAAERKEFGYYRRSADAFHFRELADYPEQRTVAFDSPLPFKVKAANSVFALGAA
jgi:hypothetical protein